MDFPTAKKALGQSFLVNKDVIDRILEAVRPDDKETLVEIGPGRGALTSRLLQRSGRVIAIELDRELALHLSKLFGEFDNFTLVTANALEVDVCNLIKPASETRLVANLPYYISTALLQRLIEQRHCITEMILMLQREVVQRIVAPPSSHERGFLTVMVEAYCQAERLFDVAPASFRPEPKVWSSVIRLRTRATDLNAKEEELFPRVVSAGFAQRRKTISNNLRNSPAELREAVTRAGGHTRVLEVADVDSSRRAETLALNEWIAVVRALC